MSKQSGLDWKALLQQKPPPSSVVKKSALKSRQGAHHTPSTPLASSSTGSLTADQQQQQQHTGSSIPFLLLPVAIPEQKENTVPTDQPAADLLAKLAQLKQKAASLADAAAAAKQPAAAGSAAAAQLLQRPSILQDPLPPPEHIIAPDAWLLSSSSSGSDGALDEFPASSSGRFLQEQQRQSQGFAHASARTAAVPGGDAVNMATSLTGQTNDSSSLLTTANSPDRRVQQALARIRQLQQRTHDALEEGGLQQIAEEPQASWA
uniref:Uncharacterized protein n=1 Tax=Tetradesmus obliquus TaxID=3088 RepID=A0A383W9R0_TETOB|eukprot:jgi/Sobl393_1/7400/SZX73426.1